MVASIAQVYVSSNLRWAISVRLTVRLLPLVVASEDDPATLLSPGPPLGPPQRPQNPESANSSISGVKEAGESILPDVSQRLDRNTSNSAGGCGPAGTGYANFTVDFVLGPLGVLLAWEGSVSELIAQSPGCPAETRCYVHLEAQYSSLKKDASAGSDQQAVRGHGVGGVEPEAKDSPSTRGGQRNDEANRTTGTPQNSAHSTVRYGAVSTDDDGYSSWLAQGGQGEHSTRLSSLLSSTVQKAVQQAARGRRRHRRRLQMDLRRTAALGGGSGGAREGPVLAALAAAGSQAGDPGSSNEDQQQGRKGAGGESNGTDSGRSEGHLWLSHFKDMELQPVKVRGLWDFMSNRAQDWKMFMHVLYYGNLI